MKLTNAVKRQEDRLYDDDVKELARQIVSRIAPEELATFDSAADTYLDSPGESRRQAHTRPGPLDSALLSVLAVVTPAALFIADRVLSAVVERSVDRVAEQKWWRVRILRRKTRVSDVDARLEGIAAARLTSLTPEKIDEAIEVLLQFLIERRASVDREDPLVVEVSAGNSDEDGQREKQQRPEDPTA